VLHICKVLPWDDLRILLAVSRTLSITGAAARLGVDPSTVSRRIRGLEETTHAKLLLRTPQGVALTEAATQLAAHAEGMEALAALAEREALGRALTLSGTIRVAAPEGLASSWLTPVLARFLARWPEVELRVVASEATANLALREADVSLRISHAPSPTSVGRRVAKVARAHYASADLLARETEADLPWVAYLHDPSDPHTPTWKRDPTSARRVVYRVGSPPMLLAAARAGMGVAQLPCFLGDEAPELRRIEAPHLDEAMDLWLLAHPDVRSEPRVRAFLDHVGAALDADRDLFEGRVPLGTNGP